LALHESATNAVKYGALSEPNGAIHVKWETQDNDFRLEWEETGGPAIVVIPNADGFGSVLTERSIVSHLGGKIEYDWQRNGVKIRMTVPLDRLFRFEECLLLAQSRHPVGFLALILLAFSEFSGRAPRLSPRHDF
jgi:light-regulated signal transduction histidine kinase (bacteriophytochrome)